MILEFKNESIIYNAIVISAHERYFEVVEKKIWNSLRFGRIMIIIS